MAEKKICSCVYCCLITLWIMQSTDFYRIWYKLVILTCFFVFLSIIIYIIHNSGIVKDICYIERSIVSFQYFSIVRIFIRKYLVMNNKVLSIMTTGTMLLGIGAYLPYQDIVPIENISVSAASNEETIYSYLTSKLGFNCAAACGVLANIELESSFNPNLGETGGGGYGLCQWTGSRNTDLKNWCKANGYNYTSIEGQLEFLNHELNSGYKSFYNTMKNASNDASGAYSVGYGWCMDFERPEYRNKVHGQYNSSGVPTDNGGYDYFNAYKKTYKCIAARIGLTESEYRGKIAAEKYWVKYGGNVTHDPEGYLDSVEGGHGTVTVTGWALDRDVPNDPIQIHIYMDGKPGESGICVATGIMADQPSPDVASVVGVGGNV